MASSPIWDPTTSQIVLDLTGTLNGNQRKATVSINFNQPPYKIRQVTINGIPPLGSAPYFHIWKTCPAQNPNETSAIIGDDFLVEKDTYNIKPDYRNDGCVNQGLAHSDFPMPVITMQPPPNPNPNHVEMTNFAFQALGTNITVGIVVQVQDDMGSGGSNSFKIIKPHGH